MRGERIAGTETAVAEWGDVRVEFVPTSPDRTAVLAGSTACVVRSEPE